MKKIKTGNTVDIGKVVSISFIALVSIVSAVVLYKAINTSSDIRSKAAYEMPNKYKGVLPPPPKGVPAINRENGERVR